MARQFDQVDDFEDDSRPLIMDLVEWLLQGIFFSSGMAMVTYLGFMAITAIMKL